MQEIQVSENYVGEHRFGLFRWLQSEEGWRSEAYIDTEGHWTIGYGHKLSVDAGSRENSLHYWWDSVESQYVGQLLKPAGDALLREDIIKVSGLLKGELGEEYTGKHLEGWRRVGLQCMGFQLGARGVKKFVSMRKALLSGDWGQAFSAGVDSLWHRQTPGRCGRVMRVLAYGERPLY